MSHVILLHFAEPEGVLASDAMKNLHDLGTEPGIVAPPVVSAWTGRGRSFDGASHALLAGDESELGTLLTRDATIQALLSLTMDGVVDPMTVIARGLNDGELAERYAYGLQLEPHPTTAGLVLVRWFWQNYDGDIIEAPPGVFAHPGDGKEFLLTATRRWVSSELVVVRYYVNDESLGELELTDGEISGGTIGHTSVGARKNDGTWENWFKGTIDELGVADFEMSLEEIRHEWKRLTEYQPGGVETFAASTPPGLGWGDKPDSDMGRLVKVVGQGNGLVVAEAEELRALWLPPVAVLEAAAEWEKGLKLSTKPRDSLDQRRARLVAYGSRLQGFSIPAILQAVAPLLAATTEQLEVLEYDNVVTDNFDTFDVDHKWLVGDEGTWGADGGVLEVHVDDGTDIRWSVERELCRARIGIDVGDTGQFYTSCKLSGFGAIPASTEVGILMSNRVTGDAVFFGVRNVAGSRDLGWWSSVAGVQSAWNSLEVGVAGSIWLRLFKASAAAELFVGPGAMTFGWSTTGPNAGFDFATDGTGVTSLMQWAGFAAGSTIAAPVADIDAAFDDFLAYAPDGLRSFAWYIYRDPAISGVPDVNQATALIRRMKPAHTFGGFTQAKELLAGDLRDGLAYRGPLGAW